MKNLKQKNWGFGWWMLSGLLLLILLIGVATPAQAAEIRGGDELVITADTVIDDDLFISGSRVEVNGTVKGDLIALASELIVNGNVEGSIITSGRTLTVNGRVAGSLYGGGYALTLGPDAQIGRNLYFGGFGLTLADGSSIGRSLYSANYQTIFSGDIADDVFLETSALEFDGRVGGDVQANVNAIEESQVASFMPDFPGALDPIDPGFRQGVNASINGDVNVSERTVADQQAEEITGYFGLSQSISQRIGELIALLIVGALLIRFWPVVLQRSSTKVQEQPLRSAGYGLLTTVVFFISIPIVAIIILLLGFLVGWLTYGQLFGTILTLGASTLWFVTAAFLFVFSLVTKIVIGFLAGKVILTRLAPQMALGGMTDFLYLALGLLIYEILRLGIGSLFGLIVILVGLGGIYLMVRSEQRPFAKELQAAQ